MIPAMDYARAIAYLDRAGLPAYVSFVESASARGLGSDDEPPQRIYVRVADGAILSGVPPSASHTVRSGPADSDNPFGPHALFQPACYEASAEQPVRWNGRAALRFELRLKPSCDKDVTMTALYADPQTLRPIAVEGSVPDSDRSGMTVALEERFEAVAGHTVPSSIEAHAVGRGWLFWARERARVQYASYEFYDTNPVVRRQARTTPRTLREW